MTRTRSLFLLLALGAAPLSAQGTGGLVGKVVDAATGTALRGAQVRIDAGARVATTDTAGEYRIRAISPGLHTVTVTYIGYRQSRREGVVIRADVITRAWCEDPVTDVLRRAGAEVGPVNTSQAT